MSSEDSELPDPAELFRRMQAESEAEQDRRHLPDPMELYRQMEAEAEEAGTTLPDPAELFRQLKEEEGTEGYLGETLGVDFADLGTEDDEPVTIERPGGGLPDPAELFRRLEEEEASEATPAPLPDPAELYRSLSEDEVREEPLEELGELGLFPEEPPPQEETPLRPEPAEGLDTETPDLEPDDLPDPGELFRRMQGVSLDSEPEETGMRTIDISPGSDEPLPDPAELFRRMQQEQDIPEPPGLDLLETEEDEAEVLPDPAELFRRMQAESEEGEESPGGLFPEDPEQEASPPQRVPGLDRPESPGLPALPDLEAFKAELEAEERERLEPDLLGDLSGPERFVDTVSDTAFMSGVTFAPVPEADPEPVPPPSEPEPAPKAKPAEAPPEQKVEPSPPPSRQGTVRVDHPSAVPPKPRKPQKEQRSMPPPTEKVEKPSAPVYKPAKRERKETVSSASTRIVPNRASQERVQPKQENRPGALARFFTRTKKISRHSLSIFTRQLAAMLKAGIPLHLAVSFCSESDPELSPILDDIVRKVEGGYSFSAALKEYPDSFDPVYVGLVNAGELSGRLNEMLARLADVLERELELRKRLISVVTYPMVLLGVSLLGTLGFIFFVLPTITPLFLDLDVTLPLPTRILLGFRDVMVPLSVILGVLGVALFFGWDSIKAYIRNRPTLERKLAAIPFNLPVIGAVYEKIITARVLYALSTMLDVGVTMNQALARSEVTCGNAFIAYRLKRCREDLTDGNSVSDCFRINDVFPPTALHLISAGEESAQLVKMFAYVADHFDEDVENSLDAAASLMEPLIMVFMGGIVGFIVIAAALPTVKLLQNF